MTIRLLTLINIGLLVVAQLLSYREPMPAAAIRGVTALFNLMMLVRVIAEGEYTENTLTGERDVIRREEPIRYWLGVLWILLLTLLCGGMQFIWHNN